MAPCSCLCLPDTTISFPTFSTFLSLSIVHVIHHHFCHRFHHHCHPFHLRLACHWHYRTQWVSLTCDAVMRMLLTHVVPAKTKRNKRKRAASTSSEESSEDAPEQHVQQDHVAERTANPLLVDNTPDLRIADAGPRQEGTLPAPGMHASLRPSARSQCSGRLTRVDHMQHRSSRCAN